jgi:hypothetical protein
LAPPSTRPRRSPMREEASPSSAFRRVNTRSTPSGSRGLRSIPTARTG